MSIIRTGLPILVEQIDLVDRSILNDLTQMVNFPTGIPDCDSHSPAPEASICSTLAFPPWEILVMLSQFPLTFHQIHNGMPCFIA